MWVSGMCAWRSEVLKQCLEAWRSQLCACVTFKNHHTPLYRAPCEVCGRGEDPACSLSVVLATGLDDHMSYMGENFAAKYLECAVAPAEASSSAESAMMAKATKQLA